MTDTNTLWLKGYTADGFHVSLTVAVEPSELAASIQDALTAIRAAGILPREQGVEPGELTETLHAVIRRSKVNEDGSETPVIDFYTEAFEFKVLHVYLNTKEDVSAFERATGLTLDSIKYFEGSAAISKTDRLYSKYATLTETRPQFTYRKNPKWDDSKTPTENKVPKHLFSRWLGTESKTDRLVREIDEERPDHLKDTEKTFTANTCVTKKYGEKTFYEFTGNGVTAGCWSLTEVGGKDVFEADEFDKLHKVGKHELVPMLVTYTGVTGKDGKQHNKVLRLALMEIAF